MRSILVLGSGSAGLIAALTLKRAMPAVSVRIVRSPEIGVITVGESTTPIVPHHLTENLGIGRRRFYSMAEPTWKMGIKFLWGSRPYFNYSFEPQLDLRASALPRPYGYYCDDDFEYLNLHSALMTHDKAFGRQAKGGGPNIPPWHALHLENPKLVKTLEAIARERGIEFTDAKVKGAERGPAGVAAVVLEDGRRLEADFYIDASGFRSELLGRTLEEPYISFSSSLFNDRAVVGGWERTDEPILPYTTAETMDSGWCWRIDHEKLINRGYVYCSTAITDDQARAEFARKNPKAKVSDRLIKFQAGRYQRGWVENVMAVGNSCGFVEPIESTSLMVVCWQCQTFVDFLQHVGASSTIRQLFNTALGATWDEIRDFLTLHFKLNTRLDTPYWRHCRADADISRLATLLEFYEENGPTGFARHYLQGVGSQFGVEGFLAILVGCQAPYRNRHQASDIERQFICNHRARFKAQAMNGLDVKESLAVIRHPGWRWCGEDQQRI